MHVGFSEEEQESVVIGSPGTMQELVRITILDVGGGKVKLGFAADEDVAVYREEVWERIRAESKAVLPAIVTARPTNRVPYLD